ncbi:hypothetical protein [Streptomyces drozdowiczii]
MFAMMLFPDDFEPEEHGWHVAEPYVPHQRLANALWELRRFGFVQTHWLRWEIPYRSPAGLVRCGYDTRRRRFYGMYMPPFERDRYRSSVAQIHREMRFGTGGGVLSPARPSVSAPTVSRQS